MLDTEPATGSSDASRTMRLIIVTGVAGAGKTSTLAALADHGFETIDNPPIALLDAIIDEYSGDKAGRIRVAIGVDERSRGFSTERCTRAISSLRARADLDVTLLYLESSDETLLRRFKETRRRHPIAGDDSVEAAMETERAVLEPMREQADMTIDTSDLSLNELRHEIGKRFGDSGGGGMTVSLVSFGFKRGTPRDADLMFDVRFLANPYWRPDLREMTGLDAAVDDYIAADPVFATVFGQLAELIKTLLPNYLREGKSYVNIAIGCTGGRHRSVAVTERLGRALRKEGYAPIVRHRDLSVQPPILAAVNG